MDDVLREHAAVMLQMAKTNRARSRQLNDEADQLEGLAAELLAVADVVAGGTQPYHSQPNLNSNNVATWTDTITIIDDDPQTIQVPDGGIYHLRVGINQSELISQAARQAAEGKTAVLLYPNGDKLTLTPDNFDKVPIPHATEV